jgi:hypothetical protein
MLRRGSIILGFILTATLNWGAAKTLTLEGFKPGPLTGVKSRAVGPGEAGPAKVVKLESGGTAIEITGGDRASGHYTLYRFEQPVPGDCWARLRFRFLGGEGVQAAGIFFRMSENQKDYYLFSAKPADRKFYWTVFKDDAAVKGTFDNQILPARNGWHELQFTAVKNELEWSFNGRDQFFTYNPLDVPDYRAGAMGFWVRSDSRVQFADLEVMTPEAAERRERLRKVIANVAKANPMLIAIQITAAPDPGRKTIISGSLASSEVGGPAPKAMAEAMEANETFHGLVAGGKAAAVTVPLRNKQSKVFAAVRMRMRIKPGATKEKDVNAAETIARYIEKQIPSRKELFVPIP